MPYTAKPRRARRLGALLLYAATCALAGAVPALADVERMEVLERTLVADGMAFGNVGAYERLRGRIYFTIEAASPDNQAIVDIRLAQRDAPGRVTFAADFILLKPLDAARGNGRLLYTPANQGNFDLLPALNDAAPSNLPATAAEAGNGFLMEQGYAVLSTGWSWDVTLGPGRLRADLPIATDGGRPIFGRVGGEISVTQQAVSARHGAPGTIGYEPLNPNDPGDVLTVRDSATGPRTLIPRENWYWGYSKNVATPSGTSTTHIFDPSVITLEGGFKPGAIYALSYVARGPRVAGLGMASIRDALLFLRHERVDRSGTPNPLIARGGELPRAVLAFGTAQGARLLQSMVYYGLAADSRSRLAFDGALMLDAGGRGAFNYRFAQPWRQFSPDTDLDFPADRFPFATATQTDPVTMESASLLDRADAGPVPRLFYVNTAAAYWSRGISLTHTAVDGSSDLSADRRARMYLVAGAAQIAPATGERRNLAHCGNPLDYRPLMRAMLLHLDGWVTLKKEPPASSLPTLSGGTLGRLAQYTEKFPKIPGLRQPTRIFETPRQDFGARFAEGIAEIFPPRIGRPFTTLVPLTDADGLDSAGIRMPEISAPLGTYVGWNMQNAATGAPDRLARNDGSFLPFAADDHQRGAADDPRLSLRERYPTRDSYTAAYAAATLALAEKELILGSDVNPMIERAGEFYDRLAARTYTDESCSYLKGK